MGRGKKKKKKEPEPEPEPDSDDEEEEEVRTQKTAHRSRSAELVPRCSLPLSSQSWDRCRGCAFSTRPHPRLAPSA